MLFGNGGNNKSASEASVAKETCEHDVSWEDVHGGDDLLDEYGKKQQQLKKQTNSK